MIDNLGLANKIARQEKDIFRHMIIQDTPQTLVQKVDNVIGFWPSSAAYLVFHHSELREMEFAPVGFRRNGWWSDVLSGREYYLIKSGLPSLDEYEAVLAHAVRMGKEAVKLQNLISGKVNDAH